MKFIFILFDLLFCIHIMRKANNLLILLALLVLTLSLKAGHNLDSTEQQDLAYYEALTQKETDLKVALA